MKKTPTTTRTNYTVLRQIIQQIPSGLMNSVAQRHGADIRKFSCESHFISLIFAHITKAKSLNEICDAMALHEPDLKRIRNITAPKRNTISNANRSRDPMIAEEVYWRLLEHFGNISPSFTVARKFKGFIRRFRRDIFAIDSTTLQLALNCIDWAKHRRKKAAAKTHMCLNIGTRLPHFAVIEEASHHDSTRAEQICHSLKQGNILLADRAYVKFAFLNDLEERGVFFVLREKKNMQYEVLERKPSSDPTVLADEIIYLSKEDTRKKYTNKLRLVTAEVEVDGKTVVMKFITNNLKWSPKSIAELYKNRWIIEVFFKELKQTLKLSDFIGYNDKAVKWQVWVGLIVHLILRFLKHLSKWKLSFSRLAGIVRHSLWMRINLLQTLSIYGTADPPCRPTVKEEQLYLKGFGRYTSKPMGQPRR